MKLSFKLNDKELVFLLILLLFIFLPFFYMKQGSLLVDIGREYYIPWQIIEGKVLYKDIYCNSYGPFTYLFNALIMLIFGQKLNILYFCGFLNSIFIIITLYLLAREFLNKLISFLFATVFIFALVFKTFIFNSNLPYSFSLVYALSSFLLSLLFIIKYSKNGNKQFAYLSCFFAGLSFSNKYEFIFYPLIFLWILFFLKPLKSKENITAIINFLIAPTFSMLVLFWQGVCFNDIKYNLELTYNIINAPMLKIFYSNMGMIPDISKTYMIIQKCGFFSVFALIPLFNIILFAGNLKKFFADKQILILFICFILSSVKTIAFLNVNGNGTFMFPVCLLTFIVLLERLKIKILPIFLIICIFTFAIYDFQHLKVKKYKVKTEYGKIYSGKRENKIANYILNFIKYNTKKTDRIVILPEGSLINFITKRKSNNLYYNLNPLIYKDVFGENKIISDFKNDLPEYIIIITSMNYNHYGTNYFLIGYAQNFNKIILSEYDLLENKNKVQIYKRKNLNYSI